MTRGVVFAGLSLTADEIGDRPVEVLPPVARGDIDALLARPEPPQRIGIVDGSFLQGLMLSPKEVLRALDRGVTVFGSSSLGALRAAELDRDGMRGVGRVYAMYRDGEVEGDDEVAITFDPETRRVMCEPMVNLRLALAAARDAGVVRPETAELAVRTAKDLYFPDRTHRRLRHELERTLPADELTALFAFLREAPDTKRDDALLLLEEMC